MPNVTNPLAGAVTSASGELLHETTFVVASGGRLFSNNVLVVNNLIGRGSLSVNNLPNLNWIILLHDTYLQPSVGVIHTAQNDVTWQPFVQSFSDPNLTGGLSNPGAIPITQPAIMPVGIPIRIHARLGATDMGFRVDVPQTATTLNWFTVLLCATQ